VSESEAGRALAVPGGGNFFAAGWTTGRAWAGCGSGGGRRINRDGEAGGDGSELTSGLRGCCWCCWYSECVLEEEEEEEQLLEFRRFAGASRVAWSLVFELVPQRFRQASPGS
jgi:hypothetical protein